jgi:hypothetical protein
MTTPTLFDTLTVPPVDAPTGRQHRLVLVALLREGDRGLTGEEAAQRCTIRLATSATTRLEEMSVVGDRDRFPVPLVAKSSVKERATASGRLAHVWKLTDEGARVAGELAASGGLA